jgi:hypothetical protein
MLKGDERLGRRELLLGGGTGTLAAALTFATPAGAHSGHATEGEPESTLFAAEFDGSPSRGEAVVSALGSAKAGAAGRVRVLVDEPNAAFASGQTVAVVLRPHAGAVDVDELGGATPVAAARIVPLVFGDSAPRR